MRGERNQLDRFQSIAKKLVDDHSAEFFTRSCICQNGDHMVVHEAYHSHLDSLGKELNEQAQSFITSVKTINDSIKQEIWDVCKRYVEQFAKRNQPQY